jgi:hypothetical protein
MRGTDDPLRLFESGSHFLKIRGFAINVIAGTVREHNQRSFNFPDLSGVSASGNVLV